MLPTAWLLLSMDNVGVLGGSKEEVEEVASQMESRGRGSLIRADAKISI